MEPYEIAQIPVNDICICREGLTSEDIIAFPHPISISSISGKAPKQLGLTGKANQLGRKDPQEMMRFIMWRLQVMLCVQIDMVARISDYRFESSLGSVVVYFNEVKHCDKTFTLLQSDPQEPFDRDTLATLPLAPLGPFVPPHPHRVILHLPTHLDMSTCYDILVYSIGRVFHLETRQEPKGATVVKVAFWRKEDYERSLMAGSDDLAYPAMVRIVSPYGLGSKEMEAVRRKMWEEWGVVTGPPVGSLAGLGGPLLMVPRAQDMGSLLRMEEVDVDSVGKVLIRRERRVFTEVPARSRPSAPFTKEKTTSIPFIISLKINRLQTQASPPTFGKITSLFPTDPSAKGKSEFQWAKQVAVKTRPVGSSHPPDAGPQGLAQPEGEEAPDTYPAPGRTPSTHRDPFQVLANAQIDAPVDGLGGKERGEASKEWW